LAQREPVLKQIHVPHPYYYREMYLPQLTTGPSSAAWTPDSSALIYSMGGSLWRQRVDSTIAEQLIAGPGYDYQPDCSLDGRWVLYASYYKDAIELWAFDLKAKQTHQLTHGGAVNVEPRFSPGGKRVVFVSTSYHGHFHIFAGNFANGELSGVQQLTAEHSSDLPRYYYSPIDHEINPAWSPDGSEIVFVSNRGHIYGTGGFWRMKAVPGATAHEIHYEETAWKARPEFSPDGHRLVYASYLGRQWHQLWMLPANGGDPFQLTYGDFDDVNPRWSPDGKHIAYISNRGGNTALWIFDFPGGAQRELLITERRYLNPTGHVRILTTDASGRLTPARVSVTGEDGRAYGPDSAWMHADADFDRSERATEPHYFHSEGTAVVAGPAGKVTIEVMKGFDQQLEKRTVEITSGKEVRTTFSLQPLALPADENSHWVSGDVHVHMNYGGAYRNTPKHLVLQASAENLGVVENVIVNKEERVPDIGYFSTKLDPASTATTLLQHGQEFHTTYWGHLGLLNLTQHYLLPDYAFYPNTAAASLYPANADVADLTHEQQGLVGYVHPFEDVLDPAKDKYPTDVPIDAALELPVDVALGKVDYLEVLGFSDHKSTAAIWYRLLNCGFRIPAAAGTDAMANFASLRGPVGVNRVYVDLPSSTLTISSWLSGLKQGRTFATNGPLIGFTLAGKEPGSEVNVAAADAGKELPFKAWMRSIVPVDHLKVVCDGEVVRDLRLTEARQFADAEGTLPISHSGWCLLRAWSEKAEYPVFDAYPYATTSPVYVTVEGSTPRHTADAQYFITWIDRLTQAVDSNRTWNTGEEKQHVLGLLSEARRVYERMTQ
jgi:Tol biopolymer transport system component